jgi:Uma2 family endonuclease
MIARIPPGRGRANLEKISEANPGWKVELETDGSITMSPSGTVSGARDVVLLVLLGEWQKNNAGSLFGPATGFEMPDGAVLSPDAAWISEERWAAIPVIERKGYVRIVPDVCIEIASETDRALTLIAKLQRYRAYGAAYVLLIDPYNRSTWNDGTLPPGFPTDFTRVFDAGST